MLRAEVASGSRLGRKVQEMMDRGDLVPDSVIEEIVGARIDAPDCKPGFILDGAVRTLPQARMIDRVLAKHGRGLDVVIELVVDEKALLDRLNLRIAQARMAGLPIRADDNEETFRRRQRVYREQTAPLIPYYEKQRKLKRVDGMAPVEEVGLAIDAVLDDVERKKTSRAGRKG
jgi:adenylate kinase